MNTMIAIFLLCFGVVGCSHGRQNVTFEYRSSDSDQRSPLSSIRPLRIEVKDFVDERDHPRLIGHQMNSISIEIGDTVSKQDVAKILRSALIDRLRKNGHAIKKWKANIVIAGTVSEFTIDTRLDSLIHEYTGTMTLVLNFMDRRHRLIYTHEYTLNYHEKKAVASVKSKSMVFSKVVDQLINQVMVDRELYDLLSKL